MDGTCLVYLRIGLLIVNHYLRGEIGLINFKSGAAGCEILWYRRARSDLPEEMAAGCVI